MEDTNNIDQVPEQLTRLQMTPSQVAVTRLSRVLENYPEISVDIRISLRDEMLAMPNIRFMNMETLAVAIVMIQRGGGDVNPTFFRENIDSFIVRLGEAPEGGPREIYRKRQKENVLRYIFAILANRQEL